MKQQSKNVLYAQAGGVSAVINASAAGVIEKVREHKGTFGKTYAAINGIQGVLEEALIDITDMSDADLERLKRLPGAAFKACRFDLGTEESRPDQYQRVLDVFVAYDIGYFFYNGGNGSMVTAQKVADYCASKGHPVTCIGIAKTIDNDLAFSHCSPGFGSAAKYLATSFYEASLDIYSMQVTSTKFFVMEAMGRNVGWLSLAPGLVKQAMPELPLIILPAERKFNEQKFLDKVEQTISEHGYCVCSASEGIQNEQGEFISVAAQEHALGQVFTQLGGVAANLARLTASKLNIKTHSATPDYLQRSASHLVSLTDWQIAYDAGAASVQAALDGEHGVLPVIVKTSDAPFSWGFKNVELQSVADLEQTVPDSFITEDGFGITQEALDYLNPLVQGERPCAFKNGLPDIHPIEFKTLAPKLPYFDATKK